MTTIERNDQGKIIGGPTLAEIEAKLGAIHAEPPGRHAQLCAALMIGAVRISTETEQPLAAQQNARLQMAAPLVAAVVTPVSQLNGYSRESAA